MPRFAHARRGGWLIPPVLISAAALLVAGCGGGTKHASAGSATAASPPPAKPIGAPGATVRFLTPRAGSTVTGSTVRVRVHVSGFTLDPGAVGKAARQGFGHLHFSLDGGRYDTPHYSGANGAQAAKLGVQGKYSPSVTPTITYRHVRPGRHTLVVYLANNDHSLTGVTARTTFTVRKPPPPAPMPVATTSAPTNTQAAPPTNTQAAPSPTPAPQSTPQPTPTPTPSAGGGGSGIPQGGGGDGDADNSGGPDDGDGNQ
jgi:hypothetical protein